MVPLGDDAPVYARVTGFAFLSCNNWTEARQGLLTACLAHKPRPLVVCNPDIASPEGDMLDAEPGYFAHRVADETAVVPILCGKPEAAIYRRALARLGKQRARACTHGCVTRLA